jgi:hypothetical protein
MRHHGVLAAAAAVAALGACGTTPQELPHTTTVLIGRVEYKALLPAKPRTDMGTYRPGMGGALGGLVAGIIANVPVEGEKNSYDIRSHSDKDRKINVYSKLDFEVGQCVEVLSTTDRRDQEWFLLEQVTLKASVKCR